MLSYQLSPGIVENELDTDAQSGLNSYQVDSRLQKYGKNYLPANRGPSWLEILIDQFRDFMVLVLLGATLLSGLLGEYTDAITIIAIVFLNAVLGFYQEYKAEMSLEALKQLISPKTWVIRQDEYQEIYAQNLVPGDLVVLETGVRVPADLRIIQQNGLQTVEAELTGESEPVNKQTSKIDYDTDSLGDISNMAFMGTMVTKGWGKGIVVATGVDTQMGKIADMLSDSEQEVTPLQQKLSQLGKILVLTCLVVCVLVAILGIWRGEPVYNMFMAGVSLAVAAIPEGLPAVVTISLAIGVQRMMNKNALVRKLPSVETLGSSTVICADKTGTLTTNKMIVSDINTPDEPGAISMCCQIAAFCNNAVYENGNIVKGDPTDKALLESALKHGVDYEKFLREYSFVEELQFDSYRKRMAILYKRHGRNQEKDTETRDYILMVKGAPEVIIPRCSKIFSELEGQLLTERLRENFYQINENMAQQAMRNIATAYKTLTFSEYKYYQNNLEILEDDLILTGLLGLIDPPRPEISRSLTRCRMAGVKTKMITGDHKTTAIAVGKQVNLLNDELESVIEGKELDQMSDQELAKKIGKIKIFARVSPKHKLRIVTALKQNGELVAMTGDGVNDAPAVKSADIGIAMGKTGTDVTKGAADLILADDNYATIEAAIEEGRGIYDNIKKFIKFLLSCNFGEILTMLFAMILGLPLPLKPIQILWVNLVTDGLPAIALGLDSKDNDLMTRKPKSPHDSVFAGGLFKSILGRGFLISLITIFAFARGLELKPESLDFARTMAFATLVISQLFYVFECQTATGKISVSKIIANPHIVLAVLLSFGLFCVVIYFPSMAVIFDTYSLTLEHWFIIFFLSIIPGLITAMLRKLKSSLG